MKRILLSLFFPFVVLTCLANCGIFQSYIILDIDHGGNSYFAGGYNADMHTPVYTGYDLGSPSSLILMGGEMKTWKNSGCDVTGAYLNFEVYKEGEELNTYTSINLPFSQNLGNAGDQKWEETNANINLMSLMNSSGTWKIEVYWHSPTSWGDRYDNNGGANHVASLLVTVLPVEFTQFTARASANDISLNWSTASESNCDYFSIERSSDGRKYESIGQVQAAGNSSSLSQYSYTDYDPVTGITYYRLKQVDLDASYTYSESLNIVFKPNNKEIKIYPIPSEGTMTIESKQAISIIITDLNGKVVFDRFYTTGQTDINLRNLGKGLYLYRIVERKSGTALKHGKLILQ